MAWISDSLSKVKVPSDTGVGFVEFVSDMAMLKTELAQMVLLLCVKYSRMGTESTEASGVRDESWLEVTWDVVSSALSFGVDGLGTVVLFSLILMSECVGGVDSTDCVAGSVSEITGCPKWTWAVWVGVDVVVDGGYCLLGNVAGIGWLPLDRTLFSLILMSACVGGVDSTDCVAGSVSEITGSPKWTWVVWIGVDVGVGGGYCSLGSVAGLGWVLLDRTCFFLGRASLVPLEPFEAMVSSSSAGR